MSYLRAFISAWQMLAGPMAASARLSRHEVSLIKKNRARYTDICGYCVCYAFVCAHVSTSVNWCECFLVFVCAIPMCGSLHSYHHSKETLWQTDYKREVSLKTGTEMTSYEVASGRLAPLLLGCHLLPLCTLCAQYMDSCAIRTLCDSFFFLYLFCLSVSLLF